MTSVPRPSIIQDSEITREHLLSYIQKKNNAVDLEQIGKAIIFSIEAHANQFRKSGMPYAEHPIEVAKILADYQVDTATIIAGLLHDVIEDTSFTFNDIKEKFDYEIAFMVDAVTKISALQEKSRIDRKAETYRKLLLSMAKDTRVIMIKFADRLHNMRTLTYVPSDKKKTIATETLEVYAPLAHRFGLNKIKSELEDLSFKYLNPDQYNFLIQCFFEDKDEREKYIKHVVETLQLKLNAEAIPATVQGRPKNLYSIHKKMSSRGCSFDEIFDLFAIRIIVDDPNSCYSVLGHVHNLWRPLQSRFKDFIALPKSNLYQSLHTTVVGPAEKLIEIQLRTKEMDTVSERGFAAHWSYKEINDSSHHIDWLDQMVNIQKEISDSSEFLEFFRIDLKPKELIVYTPKGDTISLPDGATVLDFAFAIHTNIGSHCIGAKIDEQFVNIDHVLVYGNRINIIKSEHQQPTLDWLNVCKTHKAKAAVRKWHRKFENSQIVNLGKAILKREYKHLKIIKEHQLKLFDFNNEFGMHKTWDAFFHRLGTGDISIHHLGRYLSQHYMTGPEESKSLVTTPEQYFMVSKQSNMMISFPKCCHPLPGDDIVGYLSHGTGIIIHKVSCSKADNVRENENFIPVQWDSTSDVNYDVRLEVLANNRNQLLDQITTVFSKHSGIAIDRASVVTAGTQARNRFRLKVKDLYQLKEVMDDIKNIPGVLKVYRNER
ncbi:MAG: bifunctional (p)ppGpp synthetase/guanosine-3',5'-bis(diphosphate) 3'-pyrophosphohydrolase [Fibrobacterales bacterium]